MYIPQLKKKAHQVQNEGTFLGNEMNLHVHVGVASGMSTVIMNCACAEVLAYDFNFLL